jgi:hypothetical protein
MLVKPFPAEPAELDTLRACTGSVPSEKAPKVWRYMGRGGPDMIKAASAFFRAWQGAIDNGSLALDTACFEAKGTSYAANGRGEKTFEPLVVGTELASQVRENPDRLGYSDMLRALLRSDALVVFGSDDPTYTASKIYPYLLAGKPLLAIFHENSSVVELMHVAGGGVCVTFNEHPTEDELATNIGKAWFAGEQNRRAMPLNKARFEPYTARAQARAVGQWFCRIQASSTPGVDLK